MRLGIYKHYKGDYYEVYNLFHGPKGLTAQYRNIVGQEFERPVAEFSQVVMAETFEGPMQQVERFTFSDAETAARAARKRLSILIRERVGSGDICRSPITNGEPVSGVTEGRIVAYWPSDEEEARGLVNPSPARFIPAMIVANWSLTPETPVCTLRLFLDGFTVTNDVITIVGGANGCLASRPYSCQPAQGAWTWIPQAPIYTKATDPYPRGDK